MRLSSSELKNARLAGIPSRAVMFWTLVEVGDLVSPPAYSGTILWEVHLVDGFSLILWPADLEGRASRAERIGMAITKTMSEVENWEIDGKEVEM